MGPLVSRQHFEKVCSYMAAAKKTSAQHVCGGDVLSEDGLGDGLYVSPAVFANCDDDMEFVRALGCKVTVLHQGRVLAEGTLDHVSSMPEVIEVYLGR